MAESTAELTPLKKIRELVLDPKFMVCMQCGVCGGTCPLGPAMDFTPRRTIYFTRAGELETVLKSRAPWMCVSCYSCQERCPRELKLTDELIPALRDAALESGIKLPDELETTLGNAFRYGNVLGESPRKRDKWVAEFPGTIPSLKPDTDVLWIVECYPSYHPRAQQTAMAFGKILNALNIDYGILGKDEKCTGDPERLSGEYGLFETLIEHYQKIFDKYNFREIVVTDPHAYNTIHNYFPKFGLNRPVKHYAEFLVERLDQLRPMLTKKVDRKVAFHDGCMLGRRAKKYDLPRQLLSAIPGIQMRTMANERDISICCGGGGGGMWLDTYIVPETGERLAERRVKQAVEAKADTLAVSCPFDLLRFEDAAKVLNFESQLAVRDILELLVESME